MFQYCQQAGLSFILHHEQGRWRFEYLSEPSMPQAGAPFHGPGPVRLAGPARRLRVCNWTAPRTVAVVGPDGSGKTTLIDAALASPVGAGYRFKRFKRYFRRVLFHVRRGTTRNDLEERLLWVILPLAWLTFSVSRGLFGRGSPVVLDRYFYDYFVRHVRDPHRPLERVTAYGFWSAMVPRPERLVVAACPAEVVHARKGEMTIGHIHALYQVYCDQILRARVPRTLFCHTGLDPQVSARQMTAFLG
ncbi:hypothetical protein [Castellaniella sp.]|uniref:hypothetical protein n=1 Tax=Castellaniella sp. TaxID=1955812 RepID=UPI0035647204